jgi:hypothetical protein
MKHKNYRARLFYCGRIHFFTLLLKPQLNSMKQVLLFSFILLSVAVSSCKRPRGSAGACFNLSRTPAKVNDTLYLLNCSVNYDKFKWTIPAFTYVDSLNRHLKFVPTAAGNIDVTLKVSNADSSSSSSITTTITVQ